MWSAYVILLRILMAAFWFLILLDITLRFEHEHYLHLIGSAPPFKTVTQILLLCSILFQSFPMRLANWVLHIYFVSARSYSYFVCWCLYYMHLIVLREILSYVMRSCVMPSTENCLFWFNQCFSSLLRNNLWFSWALYGFLN